MSAPTEQFTTFATKAQEDLTATVRAWANVWESITNDVAVDRPALVDPKVLVEKYFEIAQQGLDRQREFAKSALSAGSEAARAVTEQATSATRSVTAQTVSAVEAAAARLAATAK